MCDMTSEFCLHVSQFLQKRGGIGLEYNEDIYRTLFGPSTVSVFSVAFPPLLNNYKKRALPEMI